MGVPAGANSTPMIGVTNVVTEATTLTTVTVSAREVVAAGRGRLGFPVLLPFQRPVGFFSAALTPYLKHVQSGASGG